jgi:hypothetical protein
VGTLLIGCAVLLMVAGCAGMRSEAPEEQVHAETTQEKQDRTEATKEQE